MQKKSLQPTKREGIHLREKCHCFACLAALYRGDMIGDRESGQKTFFFWSTEWTEDLNRAHSQYGTNYKDVTQKA